MHSIRRHRRRQRRPSCRLAKWHRGESRTTLVPKRVQERALARQRPQQAPRQHAKPERPRALRRPLESL